MLLVHACIHSKLVMHVLIASQNCSLRRSVATKVVCASCNPVLRSSKRALDVPGEEKHAHKQAGD